MKKMGTFRVDCEVVNVLNPRKTAIVQKLLVDTGSDYTRLPGDVLHRVGINQVKKDVQPILANGQTITRNVGYAIVRSGKFETVDEVIFGEPGDQSLLGARTLEGFNARVDPKQKKLVAAGPVLAAGNTKIGSVLSSED